MEGNRNVLTGDIKDQFDFSSPVKALLCMFDKDPNREGLQDTPKRYLKFLDEFCNPKPFEFTTFDKEGYDQLILVKKIPFYSLCEHHLAPFFGTANIAYVPNDKGRICGISKIPRTLHKFASGFQNQERITTQVADFLQEKLNPRGVAVMLTARHLCMEMRGVKVPGAETVTTDLKGCFKLEESARAEFFQSIK